MGNSISRVGQRKSKRPPCLTRDEILGKYFFTPIPLVISRSPRLSFGAKLLYGEYFSWAYRRSGVCRPSQAVVAWHLNVTVRQIRRYQDELEDARAIVVLRRKSASNASKPNKILFCKKLRHLCPMERISNTAAVYRPAMLLEHNEKTANPAK